MKRLINAEIIKNTCINNAEDGSKVYDLIINDQYLAEMSEPGQFLEIYLPNSEMLLPRPLSICETDTRKGNIRILYSVVGKGTDVLSRIPKGNLLKVMGPIGNGFKIKENSPSLVIGGGIGAPPLLMLAKEIKKLNSKADVHIVLGFRNADSIILEDDFIKTTDYFFIATDDGSAGFKGNVIECVNTVAKDYEYGMIYSCGPRVMLKAVAEYAAELNIPAQVSMEERMACGIGACVGCAVKIKNGPDFEYKKVCKDGPVFYSKEVVWE